MSALNYDYQPIMMSWADDPMLAKYGAGSADIDASIEAWITSSRLLAMAYRRALRPQTDHFKAELEEFDRTHSEIPEPHRSLVWRLPMLSIAINRLWHAYPLDHAKLWRCYAWHLVDVDELKARGPYLHPAREMAYALLAGSLVKAATEGTP